MRTRRDSAFSFVEVLIGVSVAGILAFLSVFTASRVVTSVRQEKLASDAATLNRAVSSFVASGGDVKALKSAEEALAALKRQARDASRTPGMAGAFIDPRIQFVTESADDAKKNRPGLFWNPSSSRFEVASDRDEPGITSVTLDGSGEFGGDVDGDERSNALLYAKQGDWIWDYSEVPLPPPPGTAETPFGSPTDSILTPPSGGTGTPPAPGVSPPATSRILYSGRNFPQNKLSAIPSIE